MAFRTITAGQHSQMVLARARAFFGGGYGSVRADDVGWPFGAPLPVGGHVPDVTAVAPSGTLVIVEVETCETVASDETRSQWQTFSAHAGRSRGVFGVAVPASCITQARLQATAWGVRVDEWWTDNRF